MGAGQAPAAGAASTGGGGLGAKREKGGWLSKTRGGRARGEVFKWAFASGFKGGGSTNAAYQMVGSTELVSKAGGGWSIRAKWPARGIRVPKSLFRGAGGRARRPTPSGMEWSAVASAAARQVGQAGPPPPATVQRGHLATREWSWEQAEDTVPHRPHTRAVWEAAPRYCRRRSAKQGGGVAAVLVAAGAGRQAGRRHPLQLDGQLRKRAGQLHEGGHRGGVPRGAAVCAAGHRRASGGRRGRPGDASSAAQSLQQPTCIASVPTLPPPRPPQVGTKPRGVCSGLAGQHQQAQRGQRRQGGAHIRLTQHQAAGHGGGRRAGVGEHQRTQQRGAQACKPAKPAQASLLQACKPVQARLLCHAMTDLPFSPASRHSRRVAAASTGGRRRSALPRSTRWRRLDR